MNTPFTILFIIGFALFSLVLFLPEINAWLIKTRERMRDELREIEREIEEDNLKEIRKNAIENMRKNNEPDETKS